MKVAVLCSLPLTAMGMGIEKFMLVNARTNKMIGELTDEVNLSEYGGVPLTIRAMADDDSEVSSVFFTLEGARSKLKLENRAPWALYGDRRGNYYQGNLIPGSYTLTATPYTETNARGDAGESLTKAFTVVRRAVEAGGGCLPEKVDITECTGEAIRDAVQEKGCDYFDDKVEELDEICHEYLDDLDYREMKDLAVDGEGGTLGFTYRTFWDAQALTEFYDGKTPLNTDTDENNAKMKQLAARIDWIHDEIAQKQRIRWPGIKNFNEDYLEYSENQNEYDPKPSNCELNAMMCCWTRDRQANDNNGNCAQPYDENCVDADPADNTDICYHDASRAPESAHTASGISFFGDDFQEGDTHCHGIAWKDDPYDASFRFAGNNLFYVSFYDHLYQRGYVEAVPGAPMCGCLEKMPTVSRSDCTQVDVTEKFKVNFAGGKVDSIHRTKLDIEFNACDGATANDLYSELDQIYDDLPEEYEKFLVGPTNNNDDSNCPGTLAELDNIVD